MSFLDATRKITKTVLGSNTASIALSSIPGAFEDLRLVVTTAGSTGTPNVWLQFNGDTGANYDRTSAFCGNLGAPSTYTETAQTALVVGSTDANAASVVRIVIDIPNYAGTVFNKTVKASAVTNRDNGSIGGGEFYATWRSTAAITSILVLLSSGNLLSGTVVTLYGLL